MSKNIARRKKATRWVAHYHNQVAKVKATGKIGWAMAEGKYLLKLYFGDGETENCYYHQRDRIIEVSLADATILRLKGELPNPPAPTKFAHDFERLQRFMEKCENSRNK